MLKKISLVLIIALGISGLCFAGGQAESPKDDGETTVAFIFHNLYVEFWVASHSAIVNSLEAQGVKVIERNAQDDANKQIEMIKDAIAQRVDAIILIPIDGELGVTAGKLCNEAGIPIGVYARPPANKDAKYVVLISDNYDIAEKSMIDMTKAAKEKYEMTGEKLNPLIILGDLGDPNAIERSNAYYDILKANSDIFNESVEIPGKWDAATASANLSTALQANPDIDFIFAPSDVYLPPCETVLSNYGKWYKVGNPDHVILGSIDGGSLAGKMIDDGYLDAEGIHDLDAQARIILEKLLTAIENGDPAPEEWIETPSFALTQYNNDERKMEMWGNVIRKDKGEL